MLKVTEQITCRLGVGLGSPDTYTGIVCTDHTVLQNNGHMSHLRVDWAPIYLDASDPHLGSLQSLPFSWTRVLLHTGRWSALAVSTSPSTPMRGLRQGPRALQHGTSALSSQRVGLPSQEPPPGHAPHPACPTPDPRAGLHSELQAPSQLPSWDLDFSYHKRRSVPPLVPAASPAGGRLGYF